MLNHYIYLYLLSTCVHDFDPYSPLNLGVPLHAYLSSYIPTYFINFKAIYKVIKIAVLTSKKVIPT